MATFPALKPAARRYGFGLFPVSSVDGLGGGPVRFLHGDRRHGIELELGYEFLIQAERDLILTHYREQDGGYSAFLLPDAIWAGHSNPANIVPVGTAWAYVAQPSFDELSGLLYNVTVQLLQVI